MTMPKGYKSNNVKWTNGSQAKQSPSPSKKNVAIGAVIVIFFIAAIIVGIAYAVNWAVEQDNKEFDSFANDGCIPTTSSFSGHVSSWVCPTDTGRGR